MIKELNRIVSNQTFDEQPLTALNSEAIDFRATLEQFEKIRKIDKKDLETVVILMDYQGKKVPTVQG
ncbi:TPA: ATP-dependent DNA helicase [Legionella pneumophila]|nr:ATP-dependent DNA helicase [Legionella pneumophila]